MNLLEREQELIGRYSIIEDRHERLNAIISHKLASRELPIGERSDDLLVKGCASQVWLRVVVLEEKLDTRYAADSVMVKGLVALLVELYHDSTVVEVEDFSPRLLTELGLEQLLSATRLNGLAQIIRRFREAGHVD